LARIERKMNILLRRKKCAGVGLRPFYVYNEHYYIPEHREHVYFVFYNWIVDPGGFYARFANRMFERVFYTIIKMVGTYSVREFSNGIRLFIDSRRNNVDRWFFNFRYRSYVLYCPRRILLSVSEYRDRAVRDVPIR